MRRRIGDEELAAWLDGELAEDEAARVERAVATDPALAARADALRRGDDLLRAAFAAPMDEPVPPAIRDAIAATRVAAAPAGRASQARAPARALSWAPTALAASVALAVGLGLGATWLAPSPAIDAAPVVGVGLAGEATAAALENAPSGGEIAGVRPLASFEAGGRPCREFEIVAGSGAAAALGVACRGPDEWRVLALAAPPAAEAAAGDGFAPAGGKAGDPMGALLDALGAGEVMSPAKEAERIARGWR